jgi:hypothetical protein
LVPHIVLTAELPTEERYEISEVGIYSAGSNPSAGATDSKTLFTFTRNEVWKYQSQSSLLDIPFITSPIDDSSPTNTINQPYDVFQTNADNLALEAGLRIARYERPRFLNNAILIKSDTANLTENLDGSLNIEDGSGYVTLSGASLDISKNSPTDKIKIAFSVIDKAGIANPLPTRVRVIVDFTTTASSNAPYSRFEINLSQGDTDHANGLHDFVNNRYVVIEKEIQDLIQSDAFSWGDVSKINIYVSVFEGSVSPTLSENFYVALDAIRLENVTTTNALYAMTAYSPIKSQAASTIVKNANSSNLVEFRFAVGVR